jgi:uncharacterized OB-fold protein
MHAQDGNRCTLTRPVPRPDSVSQGFWDAAARGELVIHHCTTCGRFQHPPRPLCSTCGGTELEFTPVSGKGRLWGWTVTHHSVADGFESALPYTCMVIELVEQAGLFLLSDLIGREAIRDTLKCGMAMHVVFAHAIGGGLTLPQFTPTGGHP